MKITSTEYQELLSMAEQAGTEAVGKFARMAAQDYNADQIRRALLDIVAPKGGKPAAGGTYRSFSDIPDDVLARSIANPTIFTP